VASQPALRQAPLQQQVRLRRDGAVRGSGVVVRARHGGLKVAGAV
jgi:hypothetical protein